MLVIPKAKALALKLNHPERVLASISTAQRISVRGQEVIVTPHGVREVSQLNQLGIEAPSPILYHYDWPGRFKPYQHQQDTAAFLTIYDKGLVLNEIGTGKTQSALWAADYLIEVGAVSKVLIISPLSTLERVWGDAIYMNFTHRRATVLHGTAERRRKLLRQEADFYVINHDGVGVILPELTKRGDIDAVVIDELAVFRNSRAQRWKLLRELTRGRRFIWGLTGSPTPNAPTDAFAQVKLITPERLQGGFTLFQSQTMSQVSMFRWVPKPDAAEKVHAVMQPSVRFRRDDCMDLPPVTHSVRDVDMTEEQSRAFEAMKRDLMVEYAAGERLEINEPAAAYLIEHGIAKPSDDQE